MYLLQNSQMFTWFHFQKNFLVRKKIILMGDFNMNILHCDSDKNTAHFVDTNVCIISVTTYDLYLLSYRKPDMLEISFVTA